jgi:hypothetical protein
MGSIGAAGRGQVCSANICCRLIVGRFSELVMSETSPLRAWEGEFTLVCELLAAAKRGAGWC